ARGRSPQWTQEGRGVRVPRSVPRLERAAERIHRQVVTTGNEQVRDLDCFGERFARATDVLRPSGRDALLKMFDGWNGVAAEERRVPPLGQQQAAESGGDAWKR